MAEIAGSQNFILPHQKTPVERTLDDVELSVRSRQLLASSEALAAMEASLHPLDDNEAAKSIAWLAQAQVLHQAILAVNAQANIDPILAKRVLKLSQGDDIRQALNFRAQQLEGTIAQTHEEDTKDAEES